MKKLEKLKIFLKEHPNYNFIGQTTEESIKQLEKKLNIKSSDELKDYLMTYGVLSFNSVEFLGLGVPDTSYLNIITTTLELIRKGNLPLGYVVIEDLSDGSYAVYDNKKVYLWEYSSSDVGEILANSLDDYLFERCNKTLSSQ